MKTETVSLNTQWLFCFSNLLREDSKWIIRWTLCKIKIINAAKISRKNIKNKM